MICGRCGHENPSSAAVCPLCGASLAHKSRLATVSSQVACVVPALIPVATTPLFWFPTETMFLAILAVLLLVPCVALVMGIIALVQILTSHGRVLGLKTAISGILMSIGGLAIVVTVWSIIARAR